LVIFFFSSRRRHTRSKRDWSSDVCSSDLTTNLAPICFVSYLSFNPPMVGFAAGKQSHTGKRVRETGKVIVTVPGESLAGAVMACGGSTGATTNKVDENHIEM